MRAFPKRGEISMQAQVNGVKCSFCSSENVEKIARIGQAQLVSQYYCNDCRSVFEYVRWRNEE
jgi:transposase-like protein